MAITPRSSGDISSLVYSSLSPESQREAIADLARQALKDAEQVNRRVLGHAPEHKTFVDGRKEAPLESVKPDGLIVFEFNLITDLLAWIAEQLETHSPIRTGAFAKSHKLFADGVEADPANPPPAEEYVFMSLLPYAESLEHGHSKQDPNGIYEVVATLAQRRFGNQAVVRFMYRTPFGMTLSGLAGSARRQPHKDAHQPAITVVLR